MKRTNIWETSIFTSSYPMQQREKPQKLHLLKTPKSNYHSAERKKQKSDTRKVWCRVFLPSIKITQFITIIKTLKNICYWREKGILLTSLSIKLHDTHVVFLEDFFPFVFAVVVRRDTICFKDFQLREKKLFFFLLFLCIFCWSRSQTRKNKPSK